MTSRQEFDRQRREAGEALERFEQRLTNSIADELRLMDQEQRLAVEVGTPSQVNPIRKQHLEVIYRILSFGRFDQRIVIFAGSDSDINALVAGVTRDGGFKNDAGFFVDIPL